MVRVEGFESSHLLELRYAKALSTYIHGGLSDRKAVNEIQNGDIEKDIQKFVKDQRRRAELAASNESKDRELDRLRRLAEVKIEKPASSILSSENYRTDLYSEMGLGSL